MAEPVDFAAKAAERAAAARTLAATLQQDGQLWTVEDMLKDVLATAATERVIPKAVVVYLYEVPAAPGRAAHWKFGYAQAGMGRAEEIGFLELAKQLAVEDWRGL